MSLQTRVKKLEHARSGEDDVIFINVFREGDDVPMFIVAMVPGRCPNDRTNMAIEECKREHPGVEVRVPSTG